MLRIDLVFRNHVQSLAVYALYEDSIFIDNSHNSKPWLIGIKESKLVRSSQSIQSDTTSVTLDHIDSSLRFCNNLRFSIIFIWLGLIGINGFQEFILVIMPSQEDINAVLMEEFIKDLVIRVILDAVSAESAIQGNMPIYYNPRSYLSLRLGILQIFDKPVDHSLLLIGRSWHPGVHVYVEIQVQRNIMHKTYV